MLRTDPTEQSSLVICSGMCFGDVHFFAKGFLRLSLGLACAQKRTGRTGRRERSFGRAAEGAGCCMGMLAYALGEWSFTSAYYETRMCGSWVAFVRPWV